MPLIAKTLIRWKGLHNDTQLRLYKTDMLINMYLEYMSKMLLFIKGTSVIAIGCGFPAGKRRHCNSL